MESLQFAKVYDLCQFCNGPYFVQLYLEHVIIQCVLYLYAINSCSNCVLAEIECSVLPAPDGGSVRLSGLIVGSTATYQCNTGYVLEGESVRICQEDGTWSGVEPTCRCMFCFSNRCAICLILVFTVLHSDYL